MKSNKKSAILLCEILKKRGIKHIVICPGSRNAPVIMCIVSEDYFQCYSIVDERSAAFFALGLSQKCGSTVAVLCTSGTAVLNMAPAVAEAYYQRLPLLVISADRPTEWINQGESQTLNQNGIFQNYIRASFDLVQEPETEDELWFFDRQVNEAINHTTEPYFGPVHINLRFTEPLYESGNLDVNQSNLLSEPSKEIHLKPEALNELQEIWDSKEKVMILCGQMQPDEELKNVLKSLSEKGVIVLNESTSNFNEDSFISTIDKVLIPHYNSNASSLLPDLLITIGGPLISRKIKQFFRKENGLSHWHVDSIDHYNDAFQRQNLAIKMKPEVFLKHFVDSREKNESYSLKWSSLAKTVEEKHIAFLKNAPFSDLKSLQLVLDSIPENTSLQIGNSSIIRYIQLYNSQRDKEQYANRGTSGIEGSVSTAVGYSTLNEYMTLLLIGDLSLFYDSNGLWNKYLSQKLKIVVFNNGGGGIFRIIEGPKKIDKYEEFIETHHESSIEKLCGLYGLKHFKASNEESLSNVLADFYAESSNPALLEILTPRKENDKILMDYFEFLK